MTAARKRYRVRFWETLADRWELRTTREFTEREWQAFRDLLSALGMSYVWYWAADQGRPFSSNGKSFVLTLERIEP